MSSNSTFSMPSAQACLGVTVSNGSASNNNNGNQGNQQTNQPSAQSIFAPNNQPSTNANNGRS